MSVTNLQIISDALRSLNVINETETPSAEQGAICLRELNQMLAQWAVEGNTVGYATQSATSDTCPIPDWAESAVKYKLALKIAHYFGAEPSISVVASADDAYTTLQRTIMNMNLDPADMRHLPIGSGSYGLSFDITA
jgi:hypothetical protein